MNNASLATATNATFTLNNSLISANDTVILTISGGLQFALAVMFGCIAYNHLAWPIGLLFSAILYGSLVAWRLYGFWKHRPQGSMIRRLAVGEVVLLLIPLALIPTLRGD